MEEADARLQEVVASLLNEHGGNHEPALRQTFACLHNSGLYEAQSPLEEQQREQQVLAVFRSFPFRAAAPPTPVSDTVGNIVEETQATPPSYSAIYNNGNNNNANNNSNTSNAREPEEAGEIVAAEGDPENVGEDPAAAPAPEALLPIYPEEVETHGEGLTPPGPEFSNQAGDLLQQQQALSDPEGGGNNRGIELGEVASGVTEDATEESSAQRQQQQVQELPSLLSNLSLGSGGVEETKGGDGVVEAGGGVFGGQEEDGAEQGEVEFASIVTTGGTGDNVGRVSGYPETGQEVTGRAGGSRGCGSGGVGGIEGDAGLAVAAEIIPAREGEFAQEGGPEWEEEVRVRSESGLHGDHQRALEQVEGADGGAVFVNGATVHQFDEGGGAGGGEGGVPDLDPESTGFPLEPGASAAAVVVHSSPQQEAEFDSDSVTAAAVAITASPPTEESSYSVANGTPAVVVASPGAAVAAAAEEGMESNTPVVSTVADADPSNAGTNCTAESWTKATTAVVEQAVSAEMQPGIAAPPAVASSSSSPSVTVVANAAATTATATAAPGLGISYAGGSGQAVAEGHLKTGGQPLVHANRAESPTGLSTDLQDTLKALKLRRRHRFVVMRIDGTQVVAEATGAPGEGPVQLRTALPYSDCRYAVYDQEIVTADGRKANKLFFFTWLPHNATPHNKMAYSHGKVAVRQRLEGLYDVAASSFADIEVALGLVEEDEEDSDIDF